MKSAVARSAGSFQFVRSTALNSAVCKEERLWVSERPACRCAGKVRPVFLKVFMRALSSLCIRLHGIYLGLITFLCTPLYL